MTDTIQQKSPVLILMGFSVLAVVIVLTSLTVWLKGGVLETDLLQRTRQALTEAGFIPSTVSFSGRDAALSGAVASEADAEKMLAVARDVEGVRAIHNQLRITEALQSGSDAVVLETGDVGFHVPAKNHEIEKVDLSAIQFTYAKADLGEDAIQVLQEVVTILRKNPELNIEVSAHTDNQGTALGNMAVTQARADAIRNHLLAQGVNATQVKAQGYGSARPIAPNDSEVGAKRNRRIEITVFRE